MKPTPIESRGPERRITSATFATLQPIGGGGYEKVFANPIWEIREIARGRLHLRRPQDGLSVELEATGYSLTFASPEAKDAPTPFA